MSGRTKVDACLFFYPGIMGDEQQVCRLIFECTKNTNKVPHSSYRTHVAVDDVAAEW